jgi:Hpt domain
MLKRHTHLKIVIMNTQGVHYMFSGRFDTSFLSELYGGDMESAREIFDTSVHHLSLELKNAINHFNNGDLVALRRVFHKIKPLYGYVGLPALHDHVLRFENKCAEVSDTDELRYEFEKMTATIGDSLHVLRQELGRMRSFSKTKAS